MLLCGIEQRQVDSNMDAGSHFDEEGGVDDERDWPDDPPRFVIHLTIEAADLPAGRRLAASIARSASALPGFQLVESILTEEQNPGPIHWLFCDRLAEDRRRCAREANHPGQCRSQLTQPGM